MITGLFHPNWNNNINAKKTEKHTYNILTTFDTFHYSIGFFTFKTQNSSIFMRVIGQLVPEEGGNNAVSRATHYN